MLKLQEKLEVKRKMDEQLVDETGQRIDADGNLGDPVTDRIVQSVTEFYPALVFDKNNVRASFNKVIESENDRKTKGLLELIEGLYLARKQHTQELNLIYYRMAKLGESLKRVNENVEIAFKNTSSLYDNDKEFVATLNVMYDYVKTDSRKTKRAIKDFTMFKKKHQPMLKRLSNYIDENADKYHNGNKLLK